MYFLVIIISLIYIFRGLCCVVLNDMSEHDTVLYIRKLEATVRNLQTAVKTENRAHRELRIAYMAQQRVLNKYVSVAVPCIYIVWLLLCDMLLFSLLGTYVCIILLHRTKARVNSKTSGRPASARRRSPRPGSHTGHRPMRPPSARSRGPEI